MADRLDVLLGILLDKSAQKDVVKGLSDVEKGLDSVDKASTDAAGSMGGAWDQMGKDFEQFTNTFNERFKVIDGKLIDLETNAEAAGSTLRKFSGIDLSKPARDMEALAKANAEAARDAKEAAEAEKQLQKQISDVAQLGGISEDVVRELPEGIYQAGVNAVEAEKKFKQTRIEVERLNTASGKLGQISTVLAAAGGALVGGLALSANQYVKFVENAGIKGDETANRWIAASKRVQNAQLNLGQASAAVLLPIYEKAAELAERAAGFVQRNPDLVRAALNTGLVVATLGAVGVAVAKGIKLYADFKYLAATAEYDLATRRFEASVREYLTGVIAGGKGGALTSTAGGAGAFGSVLAKATFLLTAFAGGLIATDRLFDAIEGRDVTFKDYMVELGQAASLAAKGLGDLISKIPGADSDTGNKLFVAVAQLLGLRGQGNQGGQRDFQQEANLAQATESFIKYRQQEVESERQYMQQRAQVVEQGASQLAQIESGYAKQRAALAREFALSSAQALANFNLKQEQAAQQFAASEAQALANFNNERIEQREQFEEEERKSREDHLRELRKMQEDHDDRVADLVAARDALGLVKENEDFARKQRDANEEYNLEKNRRRQEFNRRAQDAEEEFQRERARRLQEFTLRQAQEAEQFAQQQKQAAAQYAERVKQLEEQHRAEIARARQQTADQLRELDLRHREEQIRRRNAFLDILRDLDANLLGEQELRKQYYDRMQADLLRFLEATANAAGGSGSNLPGYQSGGYTPDGAIRAHRGEWVANRDTTRMLEGLVGGRLTQEAVRGLAMGSNATVSLAFPGGLVSAKMVANMLDERDSKIISEVMRGLVG